MPSDGPQTRNLGSLINGISKQPPEVRLPSQAQTQENCLSRIESGVTRRPPSEHIKRFEAGAVPSEGYFLHTVDRDEAEQYLVVIENGDLRVFDLADGTEATVNTPDGKAYLNITGSDAKQAFAAVSVADTTVIVNREKVVAMSGSPTADRPNEFLVSITDMPSATVEWEAEIAGTVSTSTKINQDPAQHLATLKTAVFVFASYPNWTFTKLGGSGATVLYGEQTGNIGTPEEPVTLKNSWGNQGFGFAYKTIQDFTKLPFRGKDGFVVEVIGTDGDDTNNYWVVYEEGSEAWIETVKPGIDNAFDASTMPHKLTRTSLSPLTFDFEEITWPERLKGDEVTAPEPSFVGKTISDVVFHKNRMALLSEENVVLSESGGFFNFWPTSVIVLVESDPIDVSASNNQVALLGYAVPFRGRLSLFSGSAAVQNELVGSADEPLTITNTRVEERAFYEASKLVRPVALGNSLYFPVDRNTSSGILEYKPEQDTDRFLAEEITSHVPDYLPANIHSLVSSTTENTLVAVSADQPNALYVYSTFLNNNEKLMSSWSTWNFHEDDVIIGLSLIRTKLYVVIDRADGTHIEALELRQNNDGALSHRIHLDSLVELTGSYDAPSDTTTWTLPYSQVGSSIVVQSGAGWGNDELGQVLPGVDFGTPGQATVSGDYSTSSVHIGRVQDSFYEFSEPTLTSIRDRQALPNTQGRLQIRRWKVLFNDTAAFTAEVRYEDDDEVYYYPYSGVYVDNAIIGPPVLKDGEFEFDAQGNSRHLAVGIRSSSYLPFTLTTADWSGFYVNHRR